MTNERLYLMNGIELLSNGKYTYKDLKFKRTETLEKILKELKGKNKMTNETIEKIVKVLDECCGKYDENGKFLHNYCNSDDCEYWSETNWCCCSYNKKQSQAIYTEIVEPLEKENKDYYDRNCNLQLYIDNHEEIWSRNEKQTRKELEHKAKVLERALRNAEMCHLIAIGADPSNKLIEFAVENDIKQAEKELQGETE